MSSKFNRSPLFYVGDKYKLLPYIKPLFPENINNFYEPFVGGGSVFLNIKANNYLINDIDSNVMNIHKMLFYNAEKPDLFYRKIFKLIKKYDLSCSLKYDIVPDELKKEFKKTYFAKYNKEAYLKLREDYNKSNRKNIMHLYALLIFGFNRMLRFNSSNNFNVPVGNVDFNKNVENSLNNYFQFVLNKNIVSSDLDYIKFLNSFNYKENDFVYLDPPYLITFSEYNKIWNDKNETQLIDQLDKLNSEGIKFAISNVTHYKGRINTIFNKWSKKYKIHKIKSNYISYHDNTSKVFKEVLVTNY